MFEKLIFKRRHASHTDESGALLEEPITIEQASEDYAEKYDEASFWSKCKRYAGAIGRTGLEKAFTLYYATEHKNCSFAHKTAIYGALGYLLTPIDAIPDLTPLLGYTDDIGLIGTALVAVGSCIDDGVKYQAKDRVSRLLGEGALDGVRPFLDEDMSAVLSVWLTASIQAHNFVEPDYWASQVDNMRNDYLPASDVYVYEKQGQVVGFYALADKRLAALFVAPEHQKQGIGKQLVEHAKSHHIPLTLTVYQANHGAVEFYLDHGFKVANERIDAATGQAEYVMAWVTSQAK